ncbi:MAG: hypothetical protein ACE5GQ_06375 [Nitrospinales bacterium]
MTPGNKRPANIAPNLFKFVLLQNGYCREETQSGEDQRFIVKSSFKAVSTFVRSSGKQRPPWFYFPENKYQPIENTCIAESSFWRKVCISYALRLKEHPFIA